MPKKAASKPLIGKRERLALICLAVANGMIAGYALAEIGGSTLQDRLIAMFFCGLVNAVAALVINRYVYGR